jgi:hypothetical protein
MLRAPHLRSSTFPVTNLRSLPPVMTDERDWLAVNTLMPTWVLSSTPSGELSACERDPSRACTSRNAAAASTAIAVSRMRGVSWLGARRDDGA